MLFCSFQEEEGKKFLGEVLPANLKKLEKLLGNKQWFVGDSVSIHSLFIYSISILLVIIVTIHLFIPNLVSTKTMAVTQCKDVT